jgi:hypothetical protein
VSPVFAGAPARLLGEERFADAGFRGEQHELAGPKAACQPIQFIDVGEDPQWVLLRFVVVSFHVS